MKRLLANIVLTHIASAELPSYTYDMQVKVKVVQDFAACGDPSVLYIKNLNDIENSAIRQRVALLVAVYNIFLQGLKPPADEIDAIAKKMKCAPTKGSFLGTTNNGNLALNLDDFIDLISTKQMLENAIRKAVSPEEGEPLKGVNPLIIESMFKWADYICLQLTLYCLPIKCDDEIKSFVGDAYKYELLLGGQIEGNILHSNTKEAVNRLMNKAGLQGDDEEEGANKQITADLTEKLSIQQDVNRYQYKCETLSVVAKTYYGYATQKSYLTIRSFFWFISILCGLCISCVVYKFWFIPKKIILLLKPFLPFLIITGVLALVLAIYTSL